MKELKIGDKVYVEAEYIGLSPEGLKKFYVITGTGIKVEVRCKEGYYFSKEEVCEELVKKLKPKKKVRRRKKKEGEEK